jgi:hypothetical protein
MRPKATTAGLAGRKWRDGVSGDLLLLISSLAGAFGRCVAGDLYRRQVVKTRMTKERRAELVAVQQGFVVAGGEPCDRDCGRWVGPRKHERMSVTLTP